MSSLIYIALCLVSNFVGIYLLATNQPNGLEFLIIGLLWLIYIKIDNLQDK